MPDSHQKPGHELAQALALITHMDRTLVCQWPKRLDAHFKFFLFCQVCTSEHVSVRSVELNAWNEGCLSTLSLSLSHLHMSITLFVRLCVRVYVFIS